MCSDVFFEGSFQVNHVGELFAADALIDSIAEKAFDLVEPESASGSEVYMKARVLDQSLLNLGVLVSGVAVYNEVQYLCLLRFAVDHFDKPQPLMMAVSGWSSSCPVRA